MRHVLILLVLPRKFPVMENCEGADDGLKCVIKNEWGETKSLNLIYYMNGIERMVPESFQKYSPFLPVAEGMFHPHTGSANLLLV